jgi:hypothetical protein
MLENLASGKLAPSMNSPARLRKARYRRSAKGQAADARYKHSAKGKAASARYKQSEKGKAAAKLYRQSNAGKAAQAKAKARYRLDASRAASRR